ncbi:receptor-type tyrosine-protein phosphatase eta isoform X2 [Chelmon rostratus]|uniref:receptor-type tyrosine-protein phosphatase eta isoform X2 n=1 Tax=Chelmon rostratus TaxID=109905 RepID=UPI001BEB9F4B|nr:receptor-type tyrosine-protein phosphatase eta isoform X2 [Chelmon rostratus]
MRIHGSLNMGRFSVKVKVCVLISWALTLACSAAEQDFFTQSKPLTWDEAREHCQECFKDLVTLTPENIQAIAKKLTSEHWVGLRKNPHSSGNSSVLWSHWANGDPLTFQNWYPGWPVVNSTRGCCSCSCSCPAMTNSTGFTELGTANVTSFSGPGGFTTEDVTSSGRLTNTSVSTAAAPMTTRLPSVEAACGQSLVDTDERYIEDSCVAMLSFGAWVEKTCSEHLPFICYEERFLSKASVTNVTTSSAGLTWRPGPNVSDYRLEVRGDKNLTENLTDLAYDLVNLTAGTKYSVQVVPVKCDRDLHSQKVMFYTTPRKVENLTVAKVTETSVSLSWSKPAGNVHFYLIEVQDRHFRSLTEGIEVGRLTPGNLYAFTILSGVENNLSEGSVITAYTKPGRVSDLTASDFTTSSLKLNWLPPEGNTTGFRVAAMNDSDEVLFDEVVNRTKVRVARLPMATRITCSVTALANGTLEGDNVTVVSYTAPGPISNLTLTTTHDSLNATWSPNHNPKPDGNLTFFTIELQLGGKIVETADKLAEPKKHFDGLKSSANYTVIVYMVNGHLKGPPVESSSFTLPSMPTDGTVISFGKKYITLQWEAPANTAAVNYSVKISSSFWGHSSSVLVDNRTNHTFRGLVSGTSCREKGSQSVHVVLFGRTSPL